MEHESRGRKRRRGPGPGVAGSHLGWLEADQRHRIVCIQHASSVPLQQKQKWRRFGCTVRMSVTELRQC